MASPLEPPLYVPPSELCRRPHLPWQQHTYACHIPPWRADPPWWFTHPGKPNPALPPTDPRTPQHGNTPGFGFGLLLLPYVLDWGDQVGIMTRKKAYVSALKAYPSKYDRAYALVSVGHFCGQHDTYKEPFYDFLCLTEPFAGWRWQADALTQWMRFALAAANALGAHQSLQVTAAAVAATDWCLAVREEWERLTIENFPYGPRDMSRYWEHQTDAAT